MASETNPKDDREALPALSNTEREQRRQWVEERAKQLDVKELRLVRAALADLLATNLTARQAELVKLRTDVIQQAIEERNDGRGTVFDAIRRFTGAHGKIVRQLTIDGLYPPR